MKITVIRNKIFVSSLVAATNPAAKRIESPGRKNAKARQFQERQLPLKQGK